MKYATHKGKMYTVTTDSPCTVFNESGQILCTAKPGAQSRFIATGSNVTTDYEETEITEMSTRVLTAPGLDELQDYTFTGNLYKLNSAELSETSIPNIAEGDKRWKITLDTSITSGSTHAITGGAIFSAFFSASVKLGRSSFAGSYAVAIGDGATTDTGSIAFGKGVSSKGGDAVCLGAYSQTKGRNSSAIGKGIKVTESGVAVVGAWTAEDDKVVQLYIIAPGSPLSNTYENGAACLGYVAKDKTGNVLECGTRKLSELLTNNTAFAPAAMDLDADPPTPFLPAGTMEAVEFP